MKPFFSRLLLVVAAASAFSSASLASATSRPGPPAGNGALEESSSAPSTIAPYRARFGRIRPVVAIIGENSGTELTDFVIPFGVLAKSGVAEVVSVATRPGPITMRPALRIQPQATITQFDARFPEGADYVIVPAVTAKEDPVLLGWIAAQGAKGGTLVSICDGALVVAGTGLMNGRRATAHWATRGHRKQAYPRVLWMENVRYVGDGRIISSAGISAAIPTSVALVEAIAGRPRAVALASELGLSDWSAAHNSDMFRPRFGVNLLAYARTAYTNRRLHSVRSIGVPIAPGVDEIALALTADAYSRTGRSQAYAYSASEAPLQTRHGLTVVPDRILAGTTRVDEVLPEFDATPSAQVLDQALAGIAGKFGRSTAYGVALALEYAGFNK